MVKKVECSHDEGSGFDCEQLSGCQVRRKYNDAFDQWNVLRRSFAASDNSNRCNRGRILRRLALVAASMILLSYID